MDKCCPDHDDLPDIQSKRKPQIRRKIISEDTSHTTINIDHDDELMSSSLLKDSEPQQGDVDSWEETVAIGSLGQEYSISSIQEFLQTVTPSPSPSSVEQQPSATAQNQHENELVERDGESMLQSNAALLGQLSDHGGALDNSSGRRDDHATTSFELKYRDRQGNELSPKEAYKELSRKFHGTKPGKKRIERQFGKARRQ